MKYWEDLVGAPDHRFGPLVFGGELLDRLLDLMGEKHPVHDDDAFARALDRSRRIVPGGFILVDDYYGDWSECVTVREGVDRALLDTGAKTTRLGDLLVICGEGVGV